jgi:hypothetical protein
VNWKLSALLISLAFSATGVVAGTAEWTLQPGWGSARVLVEKSGRIAAVTGLSWPDGRSAIVSYIDANDGLYRCTDFKDASYRSTETSCEKVRN